MSSSAASIPKLFTGRIHSAFVFQVAMVEDEVVMEMILTMVSFCKSLSL